MLYLVRANIFIIVIYPLFLCRSHLGTSATFVVQYLSLADLQSIYQLKRESLVSFLKIAFYVKQSQKRDQSC
jgi:hypothetical protein